MTSKTACPSNFASDTPFLRSARPKIMKNAIVAVYENSKPRTLALGLFSYPKFTDDNKYDNELAELYIRELLDSEKEYY